MLSQVQRLCLITGDNDNANNNADNDNSLALCIHYYRRMYKWGDESMLKAMMVINHCINKLMRDMSSPEKC